MYLISSCGHPYGFRYIKHLNRPRGKSRTILGKNNASDSIKGRRNLRKKF